jgi:hypothetical protein
MLQIDQALLPMDQPVPEGGPDPVIDRIAENGCDRKNEDDNPDLQPFTCGEKTKEKEQGVSREKRCEDKPRLIKMIAKRIA